MVIDLLKVCNNRMTEPTQKYDGVKLHDGSRVSIVIAEDSTTIRHHLVSILQEVPGMEVVGQASNGEEALQLVDELRPDVVSMDIRMPHMNGLEATRRIMETCPTPVVVVSGLIDQDIELSFNALQAGALAVVEKPPDRNSPVFDDKQRRLIRTLSAMANVSVVRRGSKKKEADAKSIMVTHAVAVGIELIAIGASAGGPNALSKLLTSFPADLPVPIVVAQHIPHEFVDGLARWLNKVTALTVRTAMDGLRLEPGVVNLSPGTEHLQVVRQGNALATQLIAEQGNHHYQPSVDVLFASVAETCGRNAIGLVLTGMGDDGAAGLLAMRQAGARTFAQDEASSTVFGMPGAAIARGAVENIVSLTEIPSAILELL